MRGDGRSTFESTSLYIYVNVNKINEQHRSVFVSGCLLRAKEAKRPSADVDGREDATAMEIEDGWLGGTVVVWVSEDGAERERGRVAKDLVEEVLKRGGRSRRDRKEIGKGNEPYP
ncbi:hypothetical protein B296_00036481 [Ensete ventricosum]|uniref:Uncharacterized protein n=1 Tax=Ensete ventricosum TaxID=4639 RepID=A0A426ZLM2_ENSVE|nr:hypothetical protein B296_00036481 [Ensete ventricosum]